MSKITFRADDDLIAQLEALEVSKSEAMREALRAYLADREPSDATERTPDTAVDDVIRERVDELLAERLDARPTPSAESRQQDINLTVSLDGGQLRGETATESAPETRASDTEDGRRTDAHATRSACNQCGEQVDSDHVYCPNCGEKATRRLFCDCGDEIRSDWSFCPGCGRRTPAADVLDSGSSR
jgi:hypothetical protein